MAATDKADYSSFYPTYARKTRVDCHGGSSPPGCHGWQRQIRQIPLSVPRTAPYFCNASIIYVLQLGSNRQTCGKNGLTPRLYNQTKPINSVAGIANKRLNNILNHEGTKNTKSF